MSNNEMRQHTINVPESLYFPNVLSPDQIVGTLESGELMAVGLDETIQWTLALENFCRFGCVRGDSVLLFEPHAIVAVAGGVQTRHEQLQLDEHEQIGCLTTIGEDVLVSVFQEKQHPKHGMAPRVLRLDPEFEVIWSTRLPVSDIAYHGCVWMGVDTNWEVEESPPWKPSTWLPFGDDQLLVSGDRILATFSEMPRSGIGCRYVLDSESGDLIWKSKASPTSSGCSIGDGKFLMGDQGYGAFKTTLFEEGESEFQTWPSHGYNILIGGELISLQMSNNLSVPQHVVCLGADGAVHQRSDRLPGYYSSKPMTMLDGNMYFWRAGHVWSWNQADGLRSVVEIKLDEGAYASALRFTDNRIGIIVNPGYAKEETHKRVVTILEC